MLVHVEYTTTLLAVHVEYTKHMFFLSLELDSMELDSRLGKRSLICFSVFEASTCAFECMHEYLLDKERQSS